MSRLGHNRERRVKELLEKDGHVVVRAAGSLGGIDLVAISRGRLAGDGPEVRLIEVKANRDGGPYMNFRREERDTLLAASRRCGARAYLYYWPSGGNLRIIPSEAWPS